MNILNNKLTMAPAPHAKSPITTGSIMLDVVIALIPACIAAGVFYGLSAIILIAVCIISAVAFEYIYNIINKREQSINDFSAVVTGVILALNLPSTLPLWMACVGTFSAIIVVKMLFGGIGQNFANPAIAARVILLVSFTSPMTAFVAPGGAGLDTVGGATPLAIADPEKLASYLDLFTGNVAGSLGETSALALLIGGVYLIVKKVITPVIPLSFLGSMMVFSLIVGEDPIYQILAGGAMIGAFFMATDYTTSPATPKGQIIFGIGCGVITMIIRVYASYPEGVSFAILLMNIICPHIDNYTKTKPLGGAN